MSDSIENKIRNISKAVNAPPIPTLLQRPEKVNEDLMGGGGGGGGGTSPCGVFIPADYGYAIYTIYEWLITQMYCREGLITGCYSVSPGEPMLGVQGGEGQVTDRDQPLTWQRQHPEFDPADQGTWGSVFGPGGLADRYVRYLVCRESGSNCTGTDPAVINRYVEILRQLYIARCGFAVSSAGACCTVSEFGGFSCAEGLGTDCLGTFYAGQSCADINGNNCGLAPNPIQQNPNEQKTRNPDEQKKVAGELIKQLKLFTRR